AVLAPSQRGPLWVKSRHRRSLRPCPLYPQKRHRLTPTPVGDLPPLFYAPSSVMNISRSLDHSFRSAISGWYSGELYQALSEFMSGNSKITTNSGFQWPPSGSLCVPPFVKLRPPCFAIIGPTLARYSSNFAASVILCSTIK